jgi:hypothetical protein
LIIPQYSSFIYLLSALIGLQIVPMPSINFTFNHISWLGGHHRGLQGWQLADPFAKPGGQGVTRHPDIVVYHAFMAVSFLADTGCLAA